ncbi:MAG: hypothetical protein PHE32_03980 [Candidatus Shapirobacteria bacterium]|jgi:hypothetical protein|nr:hypothetical protein [Candidatus Shapirobacteria bacterium]
MIIENIKKQIYDCLKAIDNSYNVIQASDNVFSQFPSITYFIENDYKTDHDNEVFGKINLVIDIWAEKSTDCYSIFQKIVTALDGIGYQLSSSADVPNQDTTIYHLNSQFATIL